MYNRQFQCNRCDYATNQNGDLKKHVIAIHTNEKGLKCNRCYFLASLQNNLRRHVINMHNDARVLRCERCSFSTKYIRRLN